MDTIYSLTLLTSFAAGVIALILALTLFMKRSQLGTRRLLSFSRAMMSVISVSVIALLVSLGVHIAFGHPPGSGQALGPMAFVTNHPAYLFAASLPLVAALLAWRYCCKQDTMLRKTAQSGSPYEISFAFSRACRIGNVIAVAGTAPLDDDGQTACKGDAYGQAKRCFEISLRAIEELGGSIDGVIRTRMMLCKADDWPEVARAHGEVFSGINPAATCIVVKGLLDPDWLVETEVDCLLT